ncbi:ATP-binding cassette domain-containing protein [Salarchaeum japonicum]|uniref:ABC transporter ATP-binding protein n=1 Tax=Salarchaeum japonicum TaxID=555573 RepID=A0AAV3SXN1_9EURY|nr:ABC transporter ATP-binding protein [Salarchaeum japonicum]
MRVETLTKRYGDVVAVDDVTLDFAPGVHCVAGPNGSGKTTLLRCLAGLTRPTSGAVERTGRVNYAFQTPSVYHDLTVADNLAVFAGFADEPREWRATLEDRLGLAPMRDRPASALSDGYRKRLDLALALLDRPDVLVLDEPLADLDPATRDAIVDTIEAYATDDRYVLASTHNLDRFDGLADRLTVMSLGRVVADLERDDWSDPETAYERALREHGWG